MKTKTREEMVLDYYDLEDELDASPTWRGRESAIFYLDELYKKTRETMQMLNLSTADLDEKQKKASEGLDNCEFGNCAFRDFEILDDSFFDAMDKACYLIYKKLNTSREEAIEILKRRAANKS
jgi:hypothetical protein